MNKREMIKMAYQAPPKNEVIDEIDKLFKKAADAPYIPHPADAEWRSLIASDPMLSKSISKLPPLAKEDALKSMVNSLTGRGGEGAGLTKSMSDPVLSRLRTTGYLPKAPGSAFGEKALAVGGKALTGAAPIMLAGAGLYGLSSLINLVKDKAKANKFESDKSTAFGKLMKDPSLSGQDKKQLEEIFDLYADVSPMVVEHPILASSIFKDLGGVGAAANTATLKSLGEIYKNREQAADFNTKNRNQGWTMAASDPQKLRSLIGGEMK